MRILICSNAYPPQFVGGAELMAHEQAKALVRLGHEVCVFAGRVNPEDRNYTHSEEIVEGINVHRVELTPEDYSAEFLNFIHPAVEEAFETILSDFRPDVVHCHNLLGLSAKIPILARLYGAKIVCTLHDFWAFCLRNTVVRPEGVPCRNLTECQSCLPRIHDGRKQNIPLEFRKCFIEMAMNQVDCFVSPSHHVAQRYIDAGFPNERIKVIPNGIDVGRFGSVCPTPYDGVRITYVGYLGAHKGVQTLLDAVALLPDLLIESLHLVVQLVGEGPHEHAYRLRVGELGLQDRVRFLGKIAPDDMPAVYAQSDIVVLPSVWEENQPVCLMEAMAAGLPIVASNQGGIPELIQHGGNGLIFTAGDAQDLSSQLAKFVGDRTERMRAGIAGRDRVEGMSHDRQVGHLVDTYAAINNPSRKLFSAKELFVAVGSLRHRIADERACFGVDGQPPRSFIPLAWIADCPIDISGVMLTGWVGAMLRALGIKGIIAAPAPLRPIINRALRRVARSRGSIAGTQRETDS